MSGSSSGSSSSKTSIYAKDMDALLEVSRALGAERDLDRLLGLILDAAARLIHADRSSVFIVDQDSGELLTRIAQASETIRLPRGKGIAGMVAEAAEMVNIPDCYSDERFNPENDKRTGYRTFAMLCAPLVNHNGRVVGVLQALNKHGHEAFTEYDEKVLAGLCGHAAVALDTAQLIQREREAQKLEQEMGLARTIQQSLLPANVPAVLGWSFAHWQQPCDATGGDYHDFLIRSDDSVDMLVGDVSGHGIGAALMMSTARAALRALHPRVDAPEELMADLNVLLEADMPADTFMTMLLCRLHADGALAYVAAGHEPPLVYRAESNSFEELDSTGLLLGALDDSEYEVARCAPLAPGDLIIAFTDGLWEVVDATGEQLGMEAVEAEVRRTASAGPASVCAALQARYYAHIGDGEVEDDVTLVVAGKTV